LAGRARWLSGRTGYPPAGQRWITPLSVGTITMFTKWPTTPTMRDGPTEGATGRVVPGQKGQTVDIRVPMVFKTHPQRAEGDHPAARRRHDHRHWPTFAVGARAGSGVPLAADDRLGRSGRRGGNCGAVRRGQDLCQQNPWTQLEPSLIACLDHLAKLFGRDRAAGPSATFQQQCNCYPACTVQCQPNRLRSVP